MSHKERQRDTRSFRWLDNWRLDVTLLLPIIAVLMLAAGLLAAAGPARRGLRIQPTEALREQ